MNPEAHDKKMDDKATEECPFVIRKCEGLYLCRETERPSGRIKRCLKEYGDECKTYEDWLKEKYLK